MLLRHFQVFCNVAGKKVAVPFSQQDTQEISQSGRYNWLVSQPASRKTTIIFIVRQNGRGKRPQINPSVGEGGGITFHSFPTKLGLKC